MAVGSAHEPHLTSVTVWVHDMKNSPHHCFYYKMKKLDLKCAERRACSTVLSDLVAQLQGHLTVHRYERLCPVHTQLHRRKSRALQPGFHSAAWAPTFLPGNSFIHSLVQYVFLGTNCRVPGSRLTRLCHLHTAWLEEALTHLWILVTLSIN